MPLNINTTQGDGKRASYQHGGGFVMAWDGISIHARTELHVFEVGSLTGQRYITNILRTVRTYTPSIICETQ